MSERAGFIRQINLLAQNSASVIVSIEVGYDINFMAIIRYEMHKQAFREITTLSFLFLVQFLCDEVGVPEITGVDSRLEVIGMVQNCIIKDPAKSVLTQRSYIHSIVILALFETPSILSQPTAREGVDVGVSNDFKIGEQIQDLEMRTQCERTPATYTSVPSFTSEPVMTSSLAPHPSIIVLLQVWFLYHVSSFRAQQIVRVLSSPDQIMMRPRWHHYIG